MSALGWLLVYNFGGHYRFAEAFGAKDWKIWRYAPNISGGSAGLSGPDLDAFVIYMVGKILFWVGIGLFLRAVWKRFVAYWSDELWAGADRTPSSRTEPGAVELPPPAPPARDKESGN